MDKEWSFKATKDESKELLLKIEQSGILQQYNSSVWVHAFSSLIVSVLFEVKNPEEGVENLSIWMKETLSHLLNEKKNG